MKKSIGDRSWTECGKSKDPLTHTHTKAQKMTNLSPLSRENRVCECVYEERTRTQGTLSSDKAHFAILTQYKQSVLSISYFNNGYTRVFVISNMHQDETLGLITFNVSEHHSCDFKHVWKPFPHVLLGDCILLLILANNNGGFTFNKQSGTQEMLLYELLSWDFLPSCLLTMTRISPSAYSIKKRKNFLLKRFDLLI